MGEDHPGQKAVVAPSLEVVLSSIRIRTSANSTRLSRTYCQAALSRGTNSYVLRTAYRRLLRVQDGSRVRERCVLVSVFQAPVLARILFRTKLQQSFTPDKGTRQARSEAQREETAV